ncbi:MAG: TerC family protein [Chloroflexi bacterium]|nr:TerC family protein [Chloroflexota bacterium]
MGTESIWLWIGFNVFVLAMLALDLGVFHRKAHAVSVKEAALWSGVWIALALTFNVGVYFWRGSEIAFEFLAGYLIEKSLSVDNIFVFVLIFAAFSVPATSQHRVLFWGVLGALVMRGALILVGAILLKQFHWIIYLFGAFLIFTGVKMALQRNEESHPEKNPLINLVRRFIPLTHHYDGDKFFVRHAGKLLATPLLLVLFVVESTDLVFAVDSIPAIFAITQDPFIVYTSNVFAILGLRSLYFVFASVVNKFYYLKLGLSAILAFVGVKMVLVDVYKIPITLSLIVIALILVIAMIASWVRARREIATAPTPTE